ncbi:MAG TPA: YndJ family transporter [Terriglobales bacterium]|nr:YndJ family transporter [Terriglobales bacterium]
METTVERAAEKGIPSMLDDKIARTSATAGAAAWAVLAALARVGMVRIGELELLFLFAPLVIVPLGMELGRVMGAGGWVMEVARRIQPVGAGFAVVAICMPPGRTAGLVALGWMAVCGLIALDGVVGLWREFGKKRTGEAPVATRSVTTHTVATHTVPAHSVAARVAALAGSVARIDLGVGGVWLVASRLGMRPMGIQEPIGLLTAVHFHYAGFATATIAAALLRSRQKRFGEDRFARERFAQEGLARDRFARDRRRNSWIERLVIAIVVLPYLVAAGFVISPALKMSAAVLFSASVACLGVVLRWQGTQAEKPAARLLLQIAAGAVFAAMFFSGVYAVGDFVHRDWLTIPQMARTHGLLNAVGFCLCGLLGWLVETTGENAH